MDAAGTSEQRTRRDGVGKPGLPLHLGLLLLAFSSGAMDAFAFLSLGGIFTGMMTGNLILVGMFSRPEFLHTLIGAATAIVFFAAGAFVGFRSTRVVAGAAAQPTVLVLRVLGPSLAAQLAATVVWGLLPSPAPEIAQYGIVALLAVALSLQTVAAKKASDIMGVTTTYVTGTLTTTMQELAESGGRGNMLRILTVVSLPVGAVCATALLLLAPRFGLLLPLAVSAIATLTISRSMRRSHPAPTAPHPA